MNLDPEGTDWKSWFAIGIAVAVVGLAILAAIPTGGSSIVIAGVAAETIATGMVATGTAVAATSVTYSAIQTSSSRETNYKGGSTYEDGDIRIDYEYNGSNGSGNVHIHSPKREVLWAVTNGVKAAYTVTKAAKALLSNHVIQVAVSKAINIVKNLAQLD